MATRSERSGLRPIHVPTLVWVLVALCVGVEAILQASDRGLLDTRALRFWAYDLGGFRPKLLIFERARFPGQTGTMFVTYTFLHGGLLHLGVNMVTLLSLGAAVVRASGRLKFFEIFMGSSIGGAIFYAFFPGAGVVMVGASGGLFGLAGALIVWEILFRVERRMPLGPVLASVAILTALNGALWLFLEGQLAWQGHLGGFLVGAALALSGVRARS